MAEDISGLSLDVLNPTTEEKKGEDVQEADLLSGFGQTGGIPTEESLFGSFKKEEDKEGKETKKETEKESEEKPEDKKEPEDIKPEDKKAEKETEEKGAAEEKTDKEEKSDPYTDVAEVLQDQGAIKEIPEDFEKSPEGLGKLFTDEVERAKNEWIDNLPEDVKYFINNWREGVPLGALVERQASIESYEAIDKDSLKDNETLSKAIIRDYLTRQEWLESEIKEEIEEIEASGKLENKSKMFLDKLIKEEKTERDYMIAEEKRKKQQAEREYQARLDNLKKDINSKKEIIPGIKINERDKKKLFDGITKFDASGKNAIMKVREANPDFDLGVAALAILYDGKFNKLSSAATTKATKELKSKLEGEHKEERPSLKGVDVNVIKKATQAWRI